MRFTRGTYNTLVNDDLQVLKTSISNWATELGFDQTGFSTTELGEHDSRFINWLGRGFHGEMQYMHKHATLRTAPADLHSGTISIISVRMNYLPPDCAEPWSVIHSPDKAYISRYALGRDYHKLMRRRLQKLANKIQVEIGDFGYRAFVDSAPVLEKALAENAGLGWIGKHSNLINRQSGSWFFLGELYTDLPLIDDANSVAENHCGSCSACIDICPTGAIVEPYVVDARLCVSYLTIELRGSIPVELRPLIGNRIYGCDDCQLACPWNKFLQHTAEGDFKPRHGLDNTHLISLFSWTEQEFLKNTEGSAIRRIGYQCWLRNIATAMGNAPFDTNMVNALTDGLNNAGDMVREHIEWALQQQQLKRALVSVPNDLARSKRVPA